jgi:hypothetical protein
MMSASLLGPGAAGREVALDFSHKEMTIEVQYRHDGRVAAESPHEAAQRQLVPTQGQGSGCLVLTQFV